MSSLEDKLSPIHFTFSKAQLPEELMPAISVYFSSTKCSRCNSAVAEYFHMTEGFAVWEQHYKCEMSKEFKDTLGKIREIEGLWTRLQDDLTAYNAIASLCEQIDTNQNGFEDEDQTMDRKKETIEVMLQCVKTELKSKERLGPQNFESLMALHFKINRQVRDLTIEFQEKILSYISGSILKYTHAQSHLEESKKKEEKEELKSSTLTDSKASNSPETSEIVKMCFFPVHPQKSISSLSRMHSKLMDVSDSDLKLKQTEEALIAKLAEVQQVSAELTDELKIRNQPINISDQKSRKKSRLRWFIFAIFAFFFLFIGMQTDVNFVKWVVTESRQIYAIDRLVELFDKYPKFKDLKIIDRNRIDLRLHIENQKELAEDLGTIVMPRIHNLRLQLSGHWSIQALDFLSNSMPEVTNLFIMKLGKQNVNISCYLKGIKAALKHTTANVTIEGFRIDEESLFSLIKSASHLERIEILKSTLDLSGKAVIKISKSNLIAIKVSEWSSLSEWSLNINLFENFVKALGTSKIKSSLKELDLSQNWNSAEDTKKIRELVDKYGFDSKVLVIEDFRGLPNPDELQIPYGSVYV